MNKADLLKLIGEAAINVENMAGGDEIEPHAYSEAVRINYLISVAQQKALGDAMLDRFQFSEIDVYLDEKVTMTPSQAGLFFLITEKMGGSDLKSLGFNKFDELSETSNATLAEQIELVRLLDEAPYCFLVETRVKMSELNVPQYAVIKLESRDQLQEAEVMIAQSLYGGNYNEDDQCFINGDIYIAEGSCSKEIDLAEYETLTKLDVAHNEFNFEKLKSTCDMDEVDAAMEYYRS